VLDLRQARIDLIPQCYQVSVHVVSPCIAGPAVRLPDIRTQSIE
jgi:hypothetical protein